MRARRLRLGVTVLVSGWLAVLGGRGPAPAAAALAGCPVFPDDHVWNVPVDTLPVHPRSDQYIASIGPAVGLHPDFGSGLFDGAPIGIPFNVVPGTQPRVPVQFEFADESDPGPYPIPPDALIEGGPGSTGDRHVLIVDRDHCVLYELFAAYPEPDGSWRAGSGAIFDLRSHALRPAGFTSADAAGLAILPGLVRRDEVLAGEIRHAIRFTAQRTQRLFVWPARHFASSLTDPAIPPMGQRFRLRASFDVTPFPAEVRVILQALKTYGLILADNGSNWFLSGVPDPGWDNDVLVPRLAQVRGADFEAVDVAGLLIHPDSGQARTDGGTGGSPASGPALALTVNQGSFGAGETLRVGLSASNVGPAVPVDLYVMVRLPDGLSALFMASLVPPTFAATPLAGDPRTFAAAVRNVTLPSGFQTALDPLFTYTFDGSEPPGPYALTVALTRAGALADGVVGPGDVLALETLQISVAP
jgi:hypothetical protein